MKRTGVIAAVLAAGLVVPSALADNKSEDTSAMPTPVQGVDDVAPLEGANSYTTDQVSQMLADNGFTQVSGLKLDDKGVWRGTATYQGASGDVAVDYRGNLFFNNKRVLKADEKDDQK